MEPNKENNFLDPRTLMAIVLVAVVWFGWQSYLAKKYPAALPPPAAATKEEAKAGKGKSPFDKDQARIKKNPDEAPSISTWTTAPEPEQIIKYENSHLSFEITSKGMGFYGIHLKEYFDRKREPVVLGQAANESLFATGLVGEAEPLNFKITQKSENVFEGEAQRGKMTVIKTVEVDPDLNSAKTRVLVRQPSADFKGVFTSLSETQLENQASSFLHPSTEHQEFVINHAGKTEHQTDFAKKDTDLSFPSVAMIGISSRYFAAAVVDKSDIIPEVQIKAGPQSKELHSTLYYKPPTAQPSFEFHYTTYAGPKSLSVLDKVDPELGSLINYGFFSAIAKILLSVLRWLHGFIGNWGFSIIALTLMVRMIVLPFNIASYRSMKKMQKIQPMIAQLRERLKSDPSTNE